MERLKNQRCRNSTRVTYYCIWKRFAKFLLRLDHRPSLWEDRIILFLGHLIEDCKLQLSMIKSYISALKCMLAKDGIALNQNQFVVTSLTRACKLNNDRIVTRLPINKNFLHLLLDELIKWYNERNLPYLKALYTALFIAAYYGLLRVGEVTQGPHVLLANNVHVGVNKKKLLFVLRSSKTHSQGDHPQMIKLNSTAASGKGKHRRNKFCPYTVINSYIQRCPHAISEYEQFFVFADWTPVLPDQVRGLLRQLISRLGLKVQIYRPP